MKILPEVQIAVNTAQPDAPVMWAAANVKMLINTAALRRTRGNRGMMEGLCCHRRGTCEFLPCPLVCVVRTGGDWQGN